MEKISFCNKGYFYKRIRQRIGEREIEKRAVIKTLTSPHAPPILKANGNNFVKRLTAGTY